MAVRFPDMTQAVDIEEEVAVIPRYEDLRKLGVGKEGRNLESYRILMLSLSMRIPITFM